MSDGHRTSSIPRPDAGRRRSSPTARSARTVKKAPARKKPAARPEPVRIADHRRSRFVLGLLATVIVAAIAGAVVVLPVKAWVNQRKELDAKQTELATLSQANAALAADIDRLQTPEGIEDAARVELGYQKQGETRVATLDTPNAPTDLPDGWPYTMVTQILSVRTRGG